MSQIKLFSYYRKGLGQFISQTDNLGNSNTNDTQATLSLDIPMQAINASNGQTEQLSDKNRTFAIVGPADVKNIHESIIRKRVPTSDTIAVSYKQMPYIEFYEIDFPWRYTPLSANNDGLLRPWMALVACRDDEFTISVQGNIRVVTLCQNILPDIKTLHLLAHAQRITDDSGKTTIDELSRILCSTPLAADTEYTIFLVPSFKQGAEGKTEGISIQQGAWDNTQSSIVTLPIYYQWKIKTVEDIQFSTLAEKLDAISLTDYSSLQDSLRIDISDTGLHPGLAKQENSANVDISTIVPSNNTKDADIGIVPMAVALKKTVINQNSAENSLREKNETLVSLLQEELKELLELSPVFQKNATDKNIAVVDEDPWVVPPVYAARQLLSDKSELNKNGLLRELNLDLENRMAAGLGATVVQENQEEFVHRAWERVEIVNQQNNIIRHLTTLIQQNEIANRRVALRRKSSVSANHKGLISDTAMRIALSACTYSTSDYLKLVNSPAEISNGEITKNIMRHAGTLESEWSRGIDFSELQKLLNKDFWQNGGEGEKLIKRFLFAYDENHTEYEIGRIRNHLWFVHSNFKFIQHILKIEQQRIKTEDDKETLGKWCFQLCDNIEKFNFLEGRDSYFDSAIHSLNDEEGTILTTSHALNNLLETSCTEVDRVRFEKQEEYNGEDLSDKLKLLDTTLIDKASTSFDSINVLDDHTTILDKTNINVTNSSSDVSYQGLLLRHKEFVQMAGDNYNANLKAISINYAENSSADDNSLLYIFDIDKLTDFSESKVKYSMTNSNIELTCDKEETKNGETKKFHPAPSSIGNTFKVGDTNVEVKEDLIKSSDKYRALQSFISILNWALNNQIKIYDYSSREEKPFAYSSESVRVVRYLKFKDSRYHYYVNVPFLIKKKCYERKKKNFQGNLVKYWLDEAERIKEMLDALNSRIYAPTRIDIDISGEKVLDLKFDRSFQITHKDYIAAIEKAAEGLSVFGVEPIQEVAETIEKATDFATDKGKARIQSLCETFYSQRNIDPKRLMEIACSKYPIMAYPEYPDPTYFYLRELSQRFILPSVDAIKSNTISCFLTNPKFEEAFLTGMNTEMGHELLWREYPTDERGSYFRKFWDSIEMPDNLDNYFDIQELHKWNNALGENHLNAENSTMYAFVVRSELMRAYPDTKIFITTCQADGKFYLNNSSNILEPLMAAWLNDDTYIVGFSKTKVDNFIKGAAMSYLAFQELPQGIRFTLPDKTYLNSATLAQDKVVRPTVWGMELKGLIIK